MKSQLGTTQTHNTAKTSKPVQKLSMPILEVGLVSSHQPNEKIAQDIADACAPALGAAEGQVWVKFTRIRRRDYAENGREFPCPDQPVFVKVTMGVVPKGDELREQVKALTKAIAKACDRPAENVHIIYEPDAKGRIAFGGKLVE